MIKRCIILVALACAAIVSVAGATVSSTPAANTPKLATKDSTVRQIVQCGQRMYAVGDFKQIRSHDEIYNRANAFSFSARPPYTMTSWNPRVNGEVNSIALGPHCGAAYLGGQFSQVHGTTARNIAEVTTGTGAVRTGFARYTNEPVETIARSGSHLLVGGYFTAINGQKRNLFASLTLGGRVDGFAHLYLTGNYHYCDFRGCAHDPPRVYNQQISHNGRYDLIEGVFTRVRGLARQQIAMLNIAGRHVTVTGWRSPLFFHHCASVESFWDRAASWSPDDRTIYVATTGYRYDTSSGGKGGPPMKYLCDAAAALPAAHQSVMPRWINWTGCDSLYSTAADSTTAYFGGHERWSHNRYGCDHPGPGHIDAPGMEGLSPLTGRLKFNPHRARGVGADDMLVTKAGLWVASDNYAGGLCGTALHDDGICFLPYR